VILIDEALSTISCLSLLVGKTVKVAEEKGQVQSVKEVAPARSLAKCGTLASGMPLFLSIGWSDPCRLLCPGLRI
jgi:hypothetical protein